MTGVFLGDLLASPNLFPIEIDPQSDSVLLVRLSPQDYQDASFLDSRIMKQQMGSAWVRWQELRQGATGIPARCHFIFHISHVGSTLLSRLLGLHPALFSLREPNILRHFANVHSLHQPDRQWDEAEHDIRLNTFLGLWSRTFVPQETAVIKATSFVSELAETLLERVPSSRAILMFMPPDKFLAALLGGAMSDITDNAVRRWERLQHRLGVSNRSMVSFSPGEQTAMSWLCEMLALQRAAERYPNRTLWINFEEFLIDPAAGLTETFRHLDVSHSPELLRDILASPYMNAYSKSPIYKYDQQVRNRILSESSTKNRIEIERGMIWLRETAKEHHEIGPVISHLNRDEQTSFVI